MQDWFGSVALFFTFWIESFVSTPPRLNHVLGHDQNHVPNSAVIDNGDNGVFGVKKIGQPFWTPDPPFSPKIKVNISMFNIFNIFLSHLSFIIIF